MHREHRLGNPKERDHFEHLGVDGKKYTLDLIDAGWGGGA